MSPILWGIIVPWLMVALFMALGAWIGFQLILQNGRLLARLEALEQRWGEWSLATARAPGPPVMPAPAPAPAPAAAAPPALPLGSPAPAFELPDLSGRPMALSAFRGRRLLLLFFNPGCGFCTRMVPDLAALPTDGAGGRPIPLVLTTGEAEQNRKLFEAHGIRCPVLLQEGMEIAAQYQCNGTPMGYLIDAQGQIASELAIGAPALLALANAPAAPAAINGNGHAPGALGGQRPVEESKIESSLAIPSGSTRRSTCTTWWPPWAGWNITLPTTSTPSSPPTNSRDPADRAGTLQVRGAGEGGAALVLTGHAAGRGAHGRSALLRRLPAAAACATVIRWTCPTCAGLRRPRGVSGPSLLPVPIPLWTVPAPRAGQENTMNRERVVPVVVLVATALLVGGPAKAAPTLISSLPYTISQPGVYEVATNLTTGALGDAILITANNVTLTVGGHTLTGPGAGLNASGIHVMATSQVTITGARITGFGAGILLDSSDYNSLTNNTATGNTEGIRLQGGCNHNTLTGNVDSGNDTGIDVNGTDNTLTGNTANNCGRDGILLLTASHNTLHGNITNSNARQGIHLENVSNSNVLDTNTANSNQIVGIFVNASSSNTLHGNTVNFNQASGILLQTGGANVVRDNMVSSNHVAGIFVANNSAGNTLVHNTAQGNTTYDLEDDGLYPCQNGWANNLYVTDNETGIAAGPMFGCIR